MKFHSLDFHERTQDGAVFLYPGTQSAPSFSPFVQLKNKGRFYFSLDGEEIKNIHSMVKSLEWNGAIKGYICHEGLPEI